MKVCTVDRARAGVVRGGRVVKWKGRAASVAPSFFLVSVSVTALSVGIAAAEVVSAPQNTRQVFFIDEDNTITSTGAVNLTTSGGPAVVIAPSYSSTFTNNGTISGPSSAAGTGQGLVLDGALNQTGQVINNGTIEINIDSTSFGGGLGVQFENTVSGAYTNNGFVSVDVSSGGGAPANALGTVFDEEVEATASVENNGTITAEVASGSTAPAAAIGMLFNSDVDTDIVNNGTIDAAAENGATLLAAGLLFQSGLNGDLINTDTIRAATSNSTGDVEAIGVRIAADADGALDNRGTILAEALGSASDAIAFGYHVVGDQNGNLSNDGTIRATAETTSANADGTAVFIQGSVTGNVTNTNTIAARGTATNSATGAGYFLLGDLNGNLENSGTISITANSSNGEAEAFGFFTGGTVSGEITNTGTVQIAAQAETSAIASAFRINSSGAIGPISNSGVISVTSTSVSDEAEARGIELSGGTDELIINDNRISVSARGADGASARAIDLRGVVSDDVVNTGVLQATAITTNDTGSFVASAASVWVENMQGTFSNSGVITATASSATDADAFGLYFENFDGEIIDVGRISATSDTGPAYAIFLGTGSGTLNVDTQDDVTGLIRVQDHNVNLDAQGGSNVFFFEDAAPGAGVFTTTVSDGRSAWFVQDDGGSAPIYATVDAADVVTLSDVTAFYGSVIGSNARVLTYDLPPQVAKGAILPGFRPYALIDAESRQFDNTPGLDTDVSVFSGSAGFSGQLDNGLAVAAGLGVFTSEGDRGTTDFDTNAVYLNAAVGRQIGAYTVEAGFGFGWLSTDRTRQINGSPDAQADYDSTLLTTHIGIERSLNVSDHFGLLGFGEARYTRQKDDSYTETGSIANATVGETTTEVVEALLGLEAQKVFNNGGILKGRLSGVLRRGLGDANTDVTLFSTTNTLTFASTDFTGARVGLGYEKELIKAMRLELTAEQEIGSDAQGPYLRAGLSWSF